MVSFFSCTSLVNTSWLARQHWFEWQASVYRPSCLEEAIHITEQIGEDVMQIMEQIGHVYTHGIE